MDLKEAVPQRVFERRLFAVSAILFPLLILAGFARTYYLKGFFGSPPLSTNVVHLHAIIMTCWVTLFIAQVWLVSARRIKTHQRLGYAAIALAALVVVLGFFTAAHAAKFGFAASPPQIPRLAFMLVPLTDLVMFVILFGAAIYFRKRPAQHKRLMLLSAVNFLPPAIARIKISALVALGPLWFFGFPALLGLIAFGLDSWKNKKANRAFLAGLLLLISSFVIRLVIMRTDTWMGIARWIISWAA